MDTNTYTPTDPTELPEGHISLIDYMGGELDIINAARISYNTERSTLDERDVKLLRYLMRHRHTTPFEMVQLKWKVKCPMYVWRQWIRHRTGSFNEISGRYTALATEFDKVPPSFWRKQSTTNKQGSQDPFVEGFLPEETGKFLTEREKELHDLARKVYKERLDMGVAREQARKDLPLSTMTHAIWSVNLHNCLHFVKLRIAADAQVEIRGFAGSILSTLRKTHPHTIRAFEDYQLYSVTLNPCDMFYMVNRQSLVDEEEEFRGTPREKQEFIAKMNTLNAHKKL